MSRKLALTAVAAVVLGLGMMISTDALARGGHGGGHGGGHFGGGHHSVGAARIHHGGFHRPGVRRPGHHHKVGHHHRPKFHHHHHRHKHWSWKLRRWVFDVDAGPVYDGPRYVAACGTCDRILSNGCYMAKRKFSTADGPVLRCVKICD